MVWVAEQLQGQGQEQATIVRLPSGLSVTRQNSQVNVTETVSAEWEDRALDIISGVMYACSHMRRSDVLEMVPATVNAAKQVASSPRVEECVGCKRCATACPTDFLSIRVYLQENEETQYSLALDLVDWTM